MQKLNVKFHRLHSNIQILSTLPNRIFAHSLLPHPLAKPPQALFPPKKHSPNPFSPPRLPALLPPSPRPASASPRIHLVYVSYMSRIYLVFKYEINTRHIRDEYEVNTRYGGSTPAALRRQWDEWLTGAGGGSPVPEGRLTDQREVLNPTRQCGAAAEKWRIIGGKRRDMEKMS